MILYIKVSLALVGPWHPLPVLYSTYLGFSSSSGGPGTPSLYQNYHGPPSGPAGGPQPPPLVPNGPLSAPGTSVFPFAQPSIRPSEPCFIFLGSDKFKNTQKKMY